MRQAKKILDVNGLGVSHLLHGDSVDGEGEKRVSLGLAVGVTGVDEGAVAWLGVGGSGCRNDPAIMAALVELSAVSVGHLGACCGHGCAY